MTKIVQKDKTERLTLLFLAFVYIACIIMYIRFL